MRRRRSLRAPHFLSASYFFFPSFLDSIRRVSSFFFSSFDMSAVRMETRRSVSESEKSIWLLPADFIGDCQSRIDMSCGAAACHQYTHRLYPLQFICMVLMEKPRGHAAGHRNRFCRLFSRPREIPCRPRYPFSARLCRDMARTTPICASSMISEVPP